MPRIHVTLRTLLVVASLSPTTLAFQTSAFAKQIDSRLELPTQCNWAVDTVITRSAPSAEARALAQRHFAKVRSLCSGEGVAPDGTRVRFSSSEPVSLVNAPEIDETQHLREHVALDGPQFHLSLWETAPDGSPDWRVECWSNAREWARIQHLGDGPSTIQRRTRDGDPSGTTGVIATWMRVRRQVQILLQAADATDAWFELANGFGALIDLRAPRLFGMLSELSLPNGVMVTPGFAELRWVVDGEEQCLTLSLRDCTNVELVTERWIFQENESIAARWETTWWIAGAAVPVERVTYSIAPRQPSACVATGANGVWPTGGAVVDERFGDALRYAIDAQGRAPSEISLAISALLRPSTTRIELPAKPASRDESRRLQLASATSLGSLPVGARARVRFALHNASQAALLIVKIHQPCDVTHVELDHELLAPGETVGVEATCSIGYRGPIEFDFEVESQELESGATTRLKVPLRAVGIDSLDVQPQLQHWVVKPGSLATPLSAPALVRGADGPALWSATSVPSLAFAPIPESDGGRIDLRFELAADWPLGATLVSLRPILSEPASGLAQVIVERRAPRADWPDAVQLLVGPSPRRIEWTLPGVVATSVSCEPVHVIGSSVARSSPSLAHRVVDGATVVTFTQTSEDSRDDRHAWSVAVESNSGPVRTLVLAFPPPREN